jgi:hypothetical protein
VIVHSVVVEVVLPFPDAVGQAGDRSAHLLLGFRVQALEAGGERVLSVAVGELDQAARRHVVGRELGQHVPFSLLAPPDVGEHEVDGVALRPRLGEQADGGQAQAFQVALGGGGHVAAGHRAPDVGPVRQVDREGDETAAVEDRAHRFHVGKVIAAHLGQVQEPHVAIPETLHRDALEELLHREAHHAHVDRDVAALGDEPALRVGERGGEIARLLEQGRARRAHDDHAHLLRDGVERVADDFQGDRAQRGGGRVAHDAVSRSRTR